MRKPVKFAAVLLVLSLIGAASWHLLHFPEAEPVYEGKRLAIWLEAGPVVSRDLDEWRRFDDWMREQTRFLVKELKTRDNPLRRPYLWIRTKAPSFLARRVPVWLDPKQVRMSAAYLLGQLGRPASNASVDALCETAAKDPSSEVRRTAIWALARIDLESEKSAECSGYCLINRCRPRSPCGSSGGFGNERIGSYGNHHRCIRPRLE